MKRILQISAVALFIVFGLTAGCIAQDLTKTYLDGSYRVTENIAEARYYRTVQAHESGQVKVLIHYTSDVVKMQGYFTDSSLAKENGEFIFYYRNGQVESRGQYCEGKKCGIWKRWAWDGSERADRLYPDPATINKRIIDEPAVFPGGYEALVQFVSAQTVYPEEAIRKRIQGVVKISFSIDEGGLVRDVEVVERNASLISQAALECMWKMPLWEPAKRDGKSIASTFILPIEFSVSGDTGSVRVGN